MALASSQSILSSLWPPFAEAVVILQAYCDYYGLRGTLVSGYRSMQEQEKLYAKGRTSSEIRNRVKKQGRNGAVTDAWPGSSAHNYGVAVDVEGPDQATIVALAAQLGFGTVSWDPAHIEWPGWERLV